MLRRALVSWGSRSDTPLVIVAFAYLGIYSGQVLMPQDSAVQPILQLLADFIYWVFAFDLVLDVISLALAPKSERNVKRFVIRNGLSFVALLAPVFRSLRIFRLVVLLRGLSGGAVQRTEKAAILLITAGPIVLYTSALAILDCERDAPGSNITNFGDAFWWAGITMTTVGYGDHYPVTTEGRLITGALLIAGIAIISTATAMVSRWIFGNDRTSKPQSDS